MKNTSKFITSSIGEKNKSQLIKAATQGIESLKAYELKPQGVFGSEAKVICGDVTIRSSELDLEFDVYF